MATQAFPIGDIPSVKAKLLNWCSQFSHSVYLDSNAYQLDCYSKYDCLAGVKSTQVLETTGRHTFDHVQKLRAQGKWVFGFFGYDLKNEIERLTSNNPDQVAFPEAGFFIPEVVISISGNSLNIESAVDSPKEIYREIEAQPGLPKWVNPGLKIQNRMSRSYYLDTVQKIKEHIADGDVYEMNFCQEWYAEEAEIDPAILFNELNRQSQKPFAAWLRWDDKCLLSASPERFLAKRDDTLIAQPIKGTINRGKTETEDRQLQAQLQNDLKERAENVMIVDLMRNDLAKSAVTGSVEVPELFGIYTFSTVHQMISTVTAELSPQVDPVEAIRNAFPMGSMTGAPKIMAMELIEKYELAKRGLYSGAVGYFSPDGDFDFNVVIRSILYNQTQKYLSFQTGGAITWHSDPEKEYEESLLKAAQIRSLLE